MNLENLEYGELGKVAHSFLCRSISKEDVESLEEATNNFETDGFRSKGSDEIYKKVGQALIRFGQKNTGGAFGRTGLAPNEFFVLVHKITVAMILDTPKGFKTRRKEKSKETILAEMIERLESDFWKLDALSKEWGSFFTLDFIEKTQCCQNLMIELTRELETMVHQSGSMARARDHLSNLYLKMRRDWRRLVNAIHKDLISIGYKIPKAVPEQMSHYSQQLRTQKKKRALAKSVPHERIQAWQKKFPCPNSENL